MGADVHPSKSVRDPLLPAAHLFVGGLSFYHAPGSEAPDDERGQKAYNWVEAQENPEVQPSDAEPFPVDAKPATLFGVFLALVFHVARNGGVTNCVPLRVFGNVISALVQVKLLCKFVIRTINRKQKNRI